MDFRGLFVNEESESSSKASYFNLRQVKILSALVIGLVVLLFAFDYGLGVYVNSLPDPVNEEASYPEQAFDSLYSELENDEMFGDRAERVSGKNLTEISGSRLEKRLLVSGTGLMDLAVTGGDVFAAVQKKDAEQPSVKGYKQLLRCPDGYSGSSRIRCTDSEYPATFSRSYKGWMNLALANGGLNRLYRNETARGSFENYIERSKFYDSYLMEGFEMRSLEAVYYSSASGLYILGEGNSSVYLEGEKLNGSKSDYIYHSNISLETGYHNVTKGGFSVDVPVYGYEPEYGLDEENGELRVAGAENRSLFFHKARVYGSDWNETLELGKNLSSLKTRGEVDRIEFVNENMSLSVVDGLKGFYSQEDERPQRGQAFGMTEEEYERFRWISNKLGFAMEDTKSIQ